MASLAGAGKLLRASLVLAVGSPLVAAPAALLPATVSIELLHLASLLHDDIIDGATERRGAPAVHVAAGTDRALVLGDMLIAAAFEVAEEIGEHAGSNAFAGAVAALSRGTQRCCLGQLEELEPRERPFSQARYLEVVASKTGSLFSTAALLGGVVAGAADEQLTALAALGTQLGVAYQIRDDLRDHAGEEWPDLKMYLRAVETARDALEAVPRPCVAALNALAETMLLHDTTSRSSFVSNQEDNNGEDR